MVTNTLSTLSQALQDPLGMMVNLIMRVMPEEKKQILGK